LSQGRVTNFWHKSLLRIAFVVPFMISPGMLHLSTGLAIRASIQMLNRTLWDKEILWLDTTLVGWIFPKGQLALWAEQSPVFSPAQPVGKWMTEILQLAYMSYYLWGNVFMAWLLLKTIVTSYKSQGADESIELTSGTERALPKQDEPKQLSVSDETWLKTRMLLYGWIAAYLASFMINFMFPAMSPRLFLEKEYHTELTGVFIGKILLNAIKSAAGGDSSAPLSFGSFPSGHCGITWLAAVAAHRLGYIRYSKVATCGACLMTLAIVYMRYHYFSDGVASMVLLAAGLRAGMMRRTDPTRPHSHTPSRFSDL